MKREIPYNIPPSIVSKSDSLFITEGIHCFEPLENACHLCGYLLSKSMFQQGSNSMGGNGFLITNKHPFVRIDIKVKKCLNKDCEATNVLFPYDQGLLVFMFNVYLNKI